MTDEIGAPPAAPAAQAPTAPAPQAPSTTPAQPADTMMSIREAARTLANRRREKAQAAQPQAATQQPEPSQSELPSQEGDAAAPEEPPSETQEAAPAETPSREPPRSWDKEARAHWQSLPPETQDYLLERDRQVTTALTKAQTEAAEKMKAVEARISEAAQAKQQYEEALPILYQTLQQQQAGEFGDIQSMADVEKMAREDWPRFALWQVQQQKMQAVQQEMQISQQRSQQERSEAWSNYAAEQDAKFAEKYPDAVKDEGVRKQAGEMLRNIGFTPQELEQAWNHGFLRDHRVQALVLNAVKHLSAQQKKAEVKPAPKPVPPVQRPGVSRGPGSPTSEVIKALDSKLNKTGNARDAARLYLARKSAG